MTEPARIVSLCPSITETLCVIGAGQRLVGVTRYCVRPRDVVRQLPKVGGTKTIDSGKIEDLHPDLIFANAEENRPDDLRALGERYRLHVSLPRRVADVAPVVRDFGLQSGCSGAAGALAEEIETLARLVPPPPTPRFRYAYFIWKDPWMTVSGDTYVSDLLGYAGGENVFGDAATRYPEVTPADVLAREPDVLFFASEPYPFSERHRLQIASAFGRQRAVELLDGGDCCWHGARTREGLSLMRALRERWGSA